MSQDAAVLKERIVSLLSSQGPTLPIMIAKNIGSSSLFTAAFLSELFEEKRIRMSFMRVGSSPVYFLDGQENLLERFANNLKSKEKEAFLILKERKFLKDVEQSPAIRVALREIKDFAIPFESTGELIWRFVSAVESEFAVKEKPLIEIKVEKAPEVVKVQEPKKERILKAKKKRKKSNPKEKGYDFFNKIKELLSSQGIEISEVKHMSSNELVLVVKDPEAKVLVAYNKKKLADSDIVRAAKRASDLGLPFKIYSSGEVLKKTRGFMDALKNLSGLEIFK